MKKIITSSFLTIIGLALFATSLVVFSTVKHTQALGCTEDTSGQYCLLEPIPLGDGSTFDKYDKGNSATDPGAYINIIIKVFISIIGVLGVIMIVLGGVQYMTTDAISKKEGGREMITNSVFGLILALASWLILQAINPNLNFININPPQGAGVTVIVNDNPPPGASTAPPGAAVCNHSPTINVNGVATPITQGAVWAAGIGNDTTNRTFLEANNLTINALNCATVGATGCTSLAGYSQTILDKLKALQATVCGTTSGCKIKVTGGTECWLHGAHGPGLPAVDLSFSTPQLITHVESVTKTCVNWINGVSSDGCPLGQAGQYIKGGAYFIKESDHYHVKQW